MTISVAPYPDLRVGAFVTHFPALLGSIDANVLGNPSLVAPPDHAVKAAVRDLLRHRGYKPTGRGKPASEYLVGAAAAGRLGPINAAVDACNAVSLRSGLPISVVDLDRTAPPFHIDVAGPKAAYVFNASGQTIRLDGLLCLFDAEGPCANPVRDSQRTKTHDGTTRTLSVVWAPATLADRLADALDAYRQRLGAMGATTEPVRLR